MPEPRRSAVGVAPAVHGGLDFEELRRLGLGPDDVLDFSANVNPYGPSPAVREALATVPLNRYPDRDALTLRGTLSRFLDTPPESILVGNGSSELIWLIAVTFIGRDDTVFVIGPTYAEYARSSRLMGGRVATWLARAGDGFAVDGAVITRELDRWRPKVVFLCNPNNPTGVVIAPDTIWNWARRLPTTLFVVDEAYQPFAPGLRSVAEWTAENLLVVRSMTKDFALAGLRLGYALGPESLIETLRRAQPPWSVNALAQAAGVAALGDPAHRTRSLAQLHQASGVLVAGLLRLGLCPVPSAVPFFLVPVADAGAFRGVMLRRGILVRDCASLGLPAHVRIATRLPEENERLLGAIEESGLGARSRIQSLQSAGGATCPQEC
jgi:histidinol-phosphate aminotransferase